MAAKNKDIENTVSIVYPMMQDEILKEQMIRREEYLARQQYREQRISQLEVETADQKERLAEKDEQLAEKDEQLTEKDEQLAEKDKEIANQMKENADKDEKIERLMQLLLSNGLNPDAVV